MAISTSMSVVVQRPVAASEFGGKYPFLVNLADADFETRLSPTLELRLVDQEADGSNGESCPVAVIICLGLGANSIRVGLDSVASKLSEPSTVSTAPTVGKICDLCRGLNGENDFRDPA